MNTYEVERAYSALTPTQRDTVRFKFERRRKRIYWAYLRWTILGLNSHHLYLEMQNAWVLWVTYQLTFAGCFLWALYDLVAIPSYVKNCNDRIMMEIIDGVR